MLRSAGSRPDEAGRRHRASGRPLDLRLLQLLVSTFGACALLLPALARAQAGASDAPGGQARAFGMAGGVAFDASVVDVSSRPNGNNGTEVVLRASPSLTLAYRGGRVQGSLVYAGALTERRGIDDRQDTDYTNNLSAAYLIEAIKDIGFIDARASVSQQSISAVGTPVDASQPSANRTEVRTVVVSPYLRSTLAGAVELEARVSGTLTDSDAAATSDSKAALASLSLRSANRGAVLGWGLTGSRQKVKFSAASSSTTTDRVTAEVSLKPDIDWRVTATGGQERTDVIGALQQTYENYGLAVQWSPSPRTTVLVQGEERYFGRSHRFSIEHRFQRSALRYLDTRSVSDGADALGAGQPVTLYEFLFAQYATQITDAVQRDQFVVALIQSLGRNRDELISGGLFANGGVSVQRRRELFWTWTGPRLTMSVSGYMVDAERADAGGVNPAALNDNTSQSGYAASLGWRLTPLVSATATGSRGMSKDRVSLARTDLKSVSLGLTSQLGRRTSGTLAARYSVLNGTADSYRETALIGSLSLRF